MRDVNLSVIIPTRNRPDRLRNCLQALTKQDFPKTRFEVIVIDDGGETPTDRVVDEFRQHLNIQLITQSHSRGPATARNTGAAHSQADYFVFTDDDCEPTDGWLSELFKSLTQHPQSMVGGRTINGLSSNIYATASQLLVDYIYRYFNRDPLHSQFLTSNNMALPAKEFDTVGGFDVSFPLAAAEDRDFCARWLHHQKQIIYLPNAFVKHSHQMGLRGFFRQHFNYGRGAYHFHQLRKLREEKPHPPEPWSFYINLAMLPFKRDARIIRLMLLLTGTQLANTLGYCYAKLSDRLSTKDRSQNLPLAN